MDLTVRRSWLIVPAHNLEAAVHACHLSADVIVLDLEYTVPSSRKVQARNSLANVIRQVSQSSAEVFVRVDRETRWCDTDAAVYPGLQGILLCGPESAEEVQDLDTLISDLECKRGIIQKSVELALILESPLGFWNVFNLATASTRVTTLGIGRVDLTMNLRPEPGGEFRLYLYLLSRLLVVARALNKQALGAHWRSVSRGGIASLEETFEAARRAWFLGFSGCLCNRPEQVEKVCKAFTPSPGEVETAERALEAFSRARKAGQMQATMNGRLYDKFKIGRFREILLYAEACRQREEARQ